MASKTPPLEIELQLPAPPQEELPDPEQAPTPRPDPQVSFFISYLLE